MIPTLGDITKLFEALLRKDGDNHENVCYAEGHLAFAMLCNLIICVAYRVDEVGQRYRLVSERERNALWRCGNCAALRRGEDREFVWWRCWEKESFVRRQRSELVLIAQFLAYTPIAEPAHRMGHQVPTA